MTATDTPITGYPTDGQTFYYHNDTTPLVSLGRVPDAPGTHVLRTPAGYTVTMGGYHLRTEGEVWTDTLAEEV